MLGRAVPLGHVRGAATGLLETDTNLAERDHLVRQAARARAGDSGYTAHQRWGGMLSAD
jgi:hypothetical protein